MNLRSVWRRVRGLIGMAITWAGAFALVGLGVGVGFWVSGQTIFDFGGAGWLWLFAKVGALTGAISGAAFALGVMAVERRGDFRIISPFRFGLLGAVAAGTVIAIMAAPESLTYGLIGAGMGFLCGSGSVIVARRALLPKSSDVPSIPPAG